MLSQGVEASWIGEVEAGRMGAANLDEPTGMAAPPYVSAPKRDQAPVRARDTSRAAIIRAMDLVIALFAIAFLSPLFLLIACAIKLSDGGPVIYWQSRIGWRGEFFPCLKFRSMIPNAEAHLRAHLDSDAAARAEWARDHKLRHDPRITRVGAFLRRSSLDELPQFINVLRGEMSIVGPRPIVAAEVVRYGRRFGAYCAARPGITGLWQISGRNDTTYRRRVALDCVFSRKLTVGQYLWIILATVPAVLARRGSY